MSTTRKDFRTARTEHRCPMGHAGCHRNIPKGERYVYYVESPGWHYGGAAHYDQWMRSHICESCARFLNLWPREQEAS